MNGLEFTMIAFGGLAVIVILALLADVGDPS